MQQYYWKVFRWENGAKGEDLTDYVVAPIFLEDKLDETLDTGEIILKRMPISTKAAFPPKTKIRLECYLDEEHTRLLDKWDMVVEHDDVEEYVGCSDICTHRVHLIEASVVAQGMHVDNIALTYELQDVDLNYKVVVPSDTQVNDRCRYQNQICLIPLKNDALKYESYSNDLRTEATSSCRFENSYSYKWDESTVRGIQHVKLYNYALNSVEIEFEIPKLYIYGVENGDLQKEPLFQLNTITSVIKRTLFNGGEVNKESIKLNGESFEIRSGAANIDNRNDSYCYCHDGIACLRKLIEFDRNTETNMVYSSLTPLYETFPVVARSGDYPDVIKFKTDVLTQSQLDAGYTLSYEIICQADEEYQDGMIEQSQQTYFASREHSAPFYVPHYNGYCTQDSLYKVQAQTLTVNASIFCMDLAKGVNTPFLKKGIKYSCYELFRKAMLTCDTYIIDNSKVCLDEWGTKDDGGFLGGVKSIEYPIIIDGMWSNRLKAVRMYESIFEGKNLWEVLIQIGYYLHAIPYLEFAEDETDRFVLKFHQLGDTKQKGDSNNKITVFNSRNLSDYFTQYDSYITNLFSPQNEVEEWITPKTSDSSYLVSNNTAELQLKYPITEIVAFDIIYNGEQKSVISNIFEASIYQVLTNADPAQIIPAKGNSVYYTLGSNKIQGLNYVAPSKNNDNLMALKYIIQRSFGVSGKDVKFNDVRFHVKYKTQDTLRMTQVRPNLLDFVKNSSYEQYPHHEQFYGQQDKIVDSERFSANLFGKLIRVGNAVYQRQEAVTEPSERKQSGDLVMIGTEPYYVTAVENECYADIMLQKVTYSKNYNQLSNIVTIPSEPRFYEVSERSKIRREVRIMEFFELSTHDVTVDPTKNVPTYMNPGWRLFLENMIFKRDRTLPNFAWMRFMADMKRQHQGANSTYIPCNVLFPSSDFEKAGENSITPKGSSDHSDCIVPLLHYPLHDGIVFEWDMEDNFKAGDFIDDKVQGEENVVDDAYIAQQSLRYVDIMGRADLFRFKLFTRNDWSSDDMRRLPQAVIDPPSDSVIGVQGSETMAIALDKDNREALSFNYQINLLHTADEYNNDFITFPNLFGNKDADLKVALLNGEVSMFDESIDLSSSMVLVANIELRISGSVRNSLRIDFPSRKTMTNEQLQHVIPGYDNLLPKVKSIVLYEDDPALGRVAYIAKNVANIPDGSKLNSWYIYPVYNG